MTPARKQKLFVLCRDLPTIRAITEATGRYFELIWASDAKTWTASAAGHEDATALLDNAAAPETAIRMYQAMQKSHPHVRRVLITDYCDLSIIVQGLHTGAVQQIVYKPIHAPELLAALGAALHQTVAPGSIPTPPPTRAVG